MLKVGADGIPSRKYGTHFIGNSRCRFVILCCFSGIPGLRLGGMRIMNLIASRLSLSVTGSSEDERSDDVCRPSWLLEPLVRTLTLTIIESKEHQCIVDGMYICKHMCRRSPAKFYRTYIYRPLSTSAFGDQLEQSLLACGHHRRVLL